MKTAAQAKQTGCASATGRYLHIDDVIASTGLSRATAYAVRDRIAELHDAERLKEAA